MATEQQYFEQGTILSEYMEKMSRLKDDSFRVYNGFNLPEDEAFFTALKEANLHVLVITEDWCGDAMMNNAILRKVAEATDLDVRCVLRDQNLELIDAHLTNGGRAIPVYLILNAEGDVVGKWGPRAPEVQQYVMDKRATLPPKDSSDFGTKQTELFVGITEEYASNDQFWQYVYEDIRQTFEQLMK
ncbi:thioredoxin family protein [Kurthia senegalensis]|uniref:thioredoxin family protein n=1 Tax=Kurthia senegalensis TaxID=1033740 RepID=UPI000288B9DE|nr:thioredoxin family protein [Kurthia senegalensis]